MRNADVGWPKKSFFFQPMKMSVLLVSVMGDNSVIPQEKGVKNNRKFRCITAMLNLEQQRESRLVAKELNLEWTRLGTLGVTWDYAS